MAKYLRQVHSRRYIERFVDQHVPRVLKTVRSLISLISGGADPKKTGLLEDTSQGYPVLWLQP